MSCASSTWILNGEEQKVIYPLVTTELRSEASVWPQNILPPSNKYSGESDHVLRDECQPPVWREANKPYPNPVLLACQPTSILLASLQQSLQFPTPQDGDPFLFQYSQCLAWTLSKC